MMRFLEEQDVAGSGGVGVPHGHPGAAGMHTPVLRAQGRGRGRLHGVGEDASVRSPHPGEAQQA